MADANIRAVITAEDRASATINQFGSKLNKFGATAARVARRSLIPLGLAAGFATKAFIDQEKAEAQLNAVLKSTGKAAGVTAKEAINLSESLMKTTTFADEAVLGAENLLLTFTKIGKDIFPDATKIVLDMSTALGQDLKSSAIQVGKALQDPVLGVTALRRVGVNFNNDQKEVIKKLVETGQSAKAQQMILKELKTEFGGSAVAARHTFGGALEFLKNMLGEVGESIGKLIANALGPVINNFDSWSKKAMQVWQTISGFLGPKVQELIGHLRILWLDVIAPMIPVLGGALVIAIGAVVDMLNILIPFINNNKVAVWALVAALVAWKVAMAIRGVVAAFTASMSVVTAVTNAAAARFLFLGAAVGAIPATVGIAVAVAGIMAVIIAFQELRRNIDAAKESADAAAASYARYQRSTAKKTGLRPEGGAHLPANLKFGKPTKKQIGGPIRAGKPYMVGEAGPEMIVPNRNAKVIPNHKLSTQSGAMHYHFHIGRLITNGVEERKFAERIVKNIQDIAAMKGTTAVALLGK